jgi:hypothetical protein
MAAAESDAGALGQTAAVADHALVVTVLRYAHVLDTAAVETRETGGFVPVPVAGVPARVDLETRSLAERDARLTHVAQTTCTQRGQAATFGQRRRTEAARRAPAR